MFYLRLAKENGISDSESCTEKARKVGKEEIHTDIGKEIRTWLLLDSLLCESSTRVL